MKKRDLLIVMSVAGLLSFFYYGPFLDNYFVWDDFMMLESESPPAKPEALKQ